MAEEKKDANKGEVVRQEGEPEIVWVNAKKVDRTYVIDGVIYASSDSVTNSVPKKLADHIGLVEEALADAVEAEQEAQVAQPEAAPKKG